MDISNLATQDDLKNEINKVDQRMASLEVRMDSFDNRMYLFENRLGRVETIMERHVQNQEKMQERLISIHQDIEILKRHAVQNEYCWKAYTDVDTIHEERTSKNEKRTALIENHLSLKPPAELLPSH